MKRLPGSPRFLGLPALLALFLLASCNWQRPQPGFTLALNPTSLTVQQGSSGQTTLTVTPQNGFTGTVALSLVAGQDQVPQGLTLSPGSVQVSGTSPVNQSLTLSAQPTTPTGTYRLKVRATSGSLTREADLTVEVTPPPPPPDFTLALNPTSLTVQQGSSGQTTLTVTPQNGFTGTVALSLVAGQDQVPQGLTLSPGSVQVSGTSPVNQSLTLSAQPTTPTGTYRLKVRATSGSLTREADLTVEVTPPPPPPDFTLALNPTSLTVQQGSSGQTTLTVTPQNGFTGTVALSLVAGQDQVPQGLTLSPGSVQVSGTSPVNQSLTLSAQPTTPTGTYRLKVRATSGSLTREADLTVEVTPPPPPPDFTLALNPTSLTVQQGSSGQTTLTVTPQNGFTGTVALSLVAGQDQVPQGLTLSPGSVQVSGTSPVNQSLTLSAQPTTPTGTYRLKVRATSGSLTREADLTVEVTPPPPPPDFTLALNPTSLTVQQGSSGQTTLTVTPQNGFTGTVALSLVAGQDQVPQGLTLSPGSVQVSGTSPVNQSLTLSAQPTTPTGTYRLKVRATSGSLTREADLTVEVTPPPPPPDFTLALNPTSLTVQQGSSGQTTLTVTPQNGFTGTVALSLVAGQDQVPQGLTLSPGSVQVSGTSPVNQSLTLSAQPTTPTGTYRLKVRATSGSLTREADLTVEVTPPPPPPDFTLALNPTSLTVHQGSSGQTTLTVTPQNGFTGTVALSLVAGQDQVPQGLTLSPGSVQVSGTSPVNQSLTLSAQPTTPTGTYRLKVRATSGSLTREADLTVEVTPPPPPPDFTLALNPTSLTVQQGSSGQTTLTVTPQNGFTGTVALSLVAGQDQVPQGLTLSPGSVQVSGTSPVNQSLTLSAQPTTPTGTYRLKVRATSGSLTREADLTVEVTPPPPPPDFTLALNPTSLTVHQGSSGQTTLTVTPQNGFTGTVALSLVAGQDQVPQGLTLSPGSVQVSGTSPVNQSLTLSAQPTTPTGTYRLKVRATSGSLTREADLTVEVTPPPPPPDFTLALNPTSLTVQQGSSGQTTLTVTPQNGFTGTVALSLVAGQDQVPQGLTLSPGSVQVSGTSPVNQSLTLSAQPTTPTGTYRLKVRATSGSLTREADLTVEVTPPPPPPDFTLALNPTSLTVQQGSSGQTTLTVTPQNGFTGTVALSLVAGQDQVPQGLTLSPGSVQVSGTSPVNQSLTLSAQPTTPTGTYRLKVRATSGSLTREADLTVEVTPPPPPPDFTLALNPTSLTVQQGSSGQTTLTVTPQNGFTGTVALSLVAGQDQVPQGLTLSPGSVQVSGTSPVNQSLTLSAQPTTPTGTYRLKVRATSGSLTREADLTVEVTPPPPPPDFTLALNPTSLTVQQGSSGQTTLTVTPQNGFTGTVALSLVAGQDQVPQGLTLSPGSVQVSGTSPVNQSLTLSAQPTTPTGTYRLKVRATSGSLTREADLTVEVTPPPPPPDFTLALNPTSLTVQQGSSGQTTLTVTPQNGFTGTVALSLVAGQDQVPQGLTLSPGSVQVSGTSPVNQSLTLSAQPTTPTGTYRLKVRATSGSLTREADLTVEVTPPPPPPDFTLALNPTSLTVQQGSSGQTTLTVTPQNGFTGTVALSLVAGQDQVPQGLTLSPGSVQVSGTSPVNQSLTLSAQPTTPTGTYRLKVRATSGSLTREADLTVEVTPPPPPPDFTLALNPTSLTVHQGSSGQTTLTVTPQNGFTGTVALSLVAGQDQVPQGLTLSPGSVQVSGTSPVNQSLTLSAQPTTPTGTYRLKVRATSGSLTREADLTVEVTPPPPPPDFTLALNPTSLTVHQGSSGQTTLTVTPQNGFTGTVALSLVAGQDQVPQGLTLSPGSVQVSGTSPVNQSLTLSAQPTTPTGTYRLKVRATSGSLTREADLTVEVTPPPPPPDFTLALNPTSLTVQQGSSGQTTLTVTPQNGFTGTVALSLVAGQDQVPQGLTLSPGSVQVSGTSPVNQSLTLSAQPTTPTGTYRLKVRATSGSLTREADLTVEVTPPPPPPDFTLALNPTSLTVQQGSSGQTTLTVTPQNGFTGTVALSLVAGQDQVPQGLTLSPGSVQVSGTSPVNQSLTLSAQPTTPTGTYRLKVRATSGSLTREADLTVEVTPPPPPPDFTLALNPTSLTVQQGSSGQTTLTVTPQNGFTGTVALSLVAGQDQVPQGLTLSPGSVQVSGTSPVNQSLTLSAQPTTPTGTYRLKVRATSGSLTREADLTVEVTPPPPPPDFTLALNPTSLTVQQGSSGQTTLTVTPQNGFTGTVALSLVAGQDQVPQGLTLSPGSVQVSGTSPVNQSLTLSAQPTTPTGTYRLKVRATSGSLTREADLTVEVTPPPPPPDFTLALNPTSLTVQQGSSGQTTLTVTPQNGFTGTVALSLVAGQDQVPQGLTLSPGSVQVSGTSPVNQSLTLSAQPTTPTGTYRLKVRATSGSLTREADLTVEVTPPPPPPDFTLALNPTSLTVQQGSSGQTTLTVTPQNGFTGTVALSLVDGSGNPVSGISLSPTSVTVSGSSPVNQTLTVSVAASVAPGTYSLQVRATSGSLAKTANLSLTVTGLVPEVTQVSSDGLRFTVKVFLEGVSTDWGGFEFRVTFDNPGFRLSDATTGDLTAACILVFDSNSGRVGAICPSDINGSGHIATLTIERQSPSQATTLSLVDGLLILSDFSELPLATGSVRLE